MAGNGVAVFHFANCSRSRCDTVRNQSRIARSACRARLSLRMVGVLAPFLRTTPDPYLDSVARPCSLQRAQLMRVMAASGVGSAIGGSDWSNSEHQSVWNAQ